jgi:uncharacterized membrane protein
MDEQQKPGAGPQGTGQDVGQQANEETGLGGGSQWTAVPPAEPPNDYAAPPPNNEAVPPPPAQSLEPLPPPPPPQQPAGGYQPVYGSQPQGVPPGYANAPGGGYPPPPQGPPPGYTGGPGPQYPPPPPPPSAGQGLSSNAAAAISYITFIPAVLFLVLAPYNRDRFVRFHAWQCIALTVVWVAIRILFAVFAIAGMHFVLFGLWTLIRLAVALILFVFWLIALIKASQGQWYKIPIVGDLAASFAGDQP